MSIPTNYYGSQAVYTNGTFPEEYIPTVFDNYSEEKDIQMTEPKAHTKRVRLDLWDTAGQEEFDRIRPLSYRDANYFLVCFSLNNHLSFEHITEKWLPEIKHHAPGKGFVLLGMKSDLECKVADEEVEAVKSTQGADAYIKVSSKENRNVDEVFQIAMRAFFKPKEEKKARRCTIL